MKKENKALVLTSIVLASSVTPSIANAEEAQVEYDSIVKEEYIKEQLGEKFLTADLKKYQDGLKAYFEKKQNINESDVKLVLEIINAYTTLGSKDKTKFTTKGTLTSIEKDIEVLNYIESLLIELKSKNAKTDIVKRVKDMKKDITGNMIGDSTKDINAVLDVGLTYIEHNSSANRKKLEEELKYVKDSAVRKSLSDALTTLKENTIVAGDVVWEGFLKEEVSDYKEEYKDIYNYYKQKAGEITTQDANKFIISVNELVKLSKDTSPTNIISMKDATNALSNSDYKTMLLETTDALESLTKIGTIEITKDNVKTELQGLSTANTALDTVSKSHYDAIKYDLTKTTALITKLIEYSKLSEATVVEDMKKTIDGMVSNANDLHSELKYATITLLTLLSSNTTLNLDNMTQDNTITVRQYISTARTNLQNPFSDINTIYSKNEILELYHNGKITSGTNDKKFNPYGVVSRAQFAVMVARATSEGSQVGLGATDTTGKWFDNHLKVIVDAGIMTTGKLGSDGRFTEDKTSKNFHPQAGILRKDMAVYLVRMLKQSGFDVSGMATKSSLSDVDENLTLTATEKDAIRVLESLDVIHGMPDGTYSPYEVANRAQIAKVLYKTLELTGHISQ